MRSATAYSSCEAVPRRGRTPVGLFSGLMISLETDCTWKPGGRTSSIDLADGSAAASGFSAAL